MNGTNPSETRSIRLNSGRQEAEMSRKGGCTGRQRMGLSAEDSGKLACVSGLSVKSL